MTDKQRSMRGRGGKVRKKEKQKKGKRTQMKKENTCTPVFTRSSQTNEAVKECETSAVQTARQHSTLHKHNSGPRGAGGAED